MDRGFILGVLLVLTPAGPGFAAGEPAKPKPDLMQKANLERIFNRLDTDKDGRLSPGEFRRLSELGHGRLKDKVKFLDKLFEKLDTDGDGALSFDEFSGLRELRRAEGSKPKKPGSEISIPGQSGQPGKQATPEQ